MKLLWLTNSPANYCLKFSSDGYNGVGWVSSAENYISNIQDIDLAIGFVMSEQSFKVKQNNTTYYPIPNPVHKTSIERFQKLMRFALNYGIKTYENKIEQYYKDYFRIIINDFKPDIIHVWGSEQYMGLVSEVTEIPVVLHIQGIINPCLNAFLPPGFSWEQWIGMKKSLCSILLRKMEKNLWKNNADREKRILKRVKYLMGRTEWDKRVSEIYAPNAIYMHSGELLREVFYKKTERIIPQIKTIVSIISNTPYKGYDMILKTASVLKNDLNVDFEWRCYGNIDPYFIEKRIGINHVDVNVRLMGVASAELLYDSLKQSTIYFHPSYIDNSPNSVCEAQLLGIPVVATNVGGISSIVNDGINGYLVPANDPFQAAYCINELFFNEEINKAFGDKGQKIATMRHNRQTIVNELLGNYDKILKSNK